MSGLRQGGVVAAALLVAAVSQGRLSHTLAWHGAQPDFVLTTLACGAILAGGARGAWLGFWAGLLTAALASQTPGSFLVSRTLAGALAGWLQGSVIQRSPVVPPLAALATTLAAEAVYGLMAPPHHLRAWAGAVGGETVYNTILAFPLYALLRRLGVGQAPDDPFARL